MLSSCCNLFSQQLIDCSVSLGRAAQRLTHTFGVQGSFYNLSLQWLIKHNFPPGPIHLTRTHKPTLPFYSSVGNFKVDYMQARHSVSCGYEC